MVIVSQYYAERSLKLHCCVRSVTYVTCMDIGWCMMSYVHCYLCDTSWVAVFPPPPRRCVIRHSPSRRCVIRHPPPDAVWYVISSRRCVIRHPPPDAVWYVIPPPDAVWYVTPLPTLCDTSSPSRRCVIRHPPPDAVWYVTPSRRCVIRHPPSRRCVIRHPLPTLCDTSSPLPTLCDSSSPLPTLCDTSSPSRRCVIRQSCHCVWHPLTLCVTSLVTECDVFTSYLVMSVYVYTVGWFMSVRSSCAMHNDGTSHYWMWPVSLQGFHLWDQTNKEQ